MSNGGPTWVDPFSASATREATARILTGMNYRLFYEGVTRRKLIETYRELAELARKFPKNDDAWKQHVRSLVENGTPEDKRLRYWLMGLTKKTAENLGIRVKDYPTVFDQMMSDIEDTPQIDQREASLLLWCGTATLTIRGSQKSKIGKSLERSLARTALTVIGLREEDGDYRLNVGADEEVPRETDAEVRTPRGYVRVEVGLIGKGNSEVISDKVGRMDRNGVILMDILPVRSTAHQTARDRGVRLIQLRNNHPVEELRQHLQNLRVANVQPEAVALEEVEERVMEMPLYAFSPNYDARLKDAITISEAEVR